MNIGNIIYEIWLNKDSVDKAYSLTNRMDIKKINEELLNYLEEYEFKNNWIEKYRKDMIYHLKEKHKISNLFPFEFAQDILKVLKEIEKGGEVLKRVFSIKCFGDSKYFEKNIENIIVKIIKIYLLDNENKEEYSKEDILLEVGISKYPEIIEFCGDLTCFINNEKIEYKKETVGSYINSYNVKEMQDLEIKNSNKIIFIENKANYIDYIQNKRKNDEFIVYHGGMYSPIKGEFFKKIYKVSKGKEFYHWSDIDIGGFKIFVRLLQIIPEVKQYKMDKESLYSKENYWKQISIDYRNKLLKMREIEEYKIFYDVIDEMLKNNCKLEQEAFI